MRLLGVLSGELERRRLVGWGLGLGLMGAGFATGFVGGGGRAQGPRQVRGSGGRGRGGRGAPERVALWAADRAGHAVYGLDVDGALLQRVEVHAPMEVRAAPGSGCFIHSALEGRRAGRSRWVEWTGSRLQGIPQLPGEPVEDGILRVRADRGGEGAWLLRAATGSCRIERWTPGGAGRDAWAKEMGRTLPFEARALAPTGHGAWVAGYRSPLAVLIDGEGDLCREVELVGADGVEDALAVPEGMGGGVWLAACGALVRLDRRGRRWPGQGGFAHLVSLAAGEAALAVSRPRAAAPPRRAFR